MLNFVNGRQDFVSCVIYQIAHTATPSSARHPLPSILGEAFLRGSARGKE